ncbi:MAG: secreted PhoX family phosphatase [Paracoccaceae bacterium]
MIIINNPELWNKACPFETFDELRWVNDEIYHIAEGYSADILLLWGNRITADAPEFEVMNQTVEA